MYIGNKLEEILIRDGISLEELSETCKIKQNILEKILKNQKEPTLEEFISIGNGLAVSFDEFFGDESMDEKIIALKTKIKQLPPNRKKEFFRELDIFFDLEHN